MVAPSQADGVRALAEPFAQQAGLIVENVTVTPAGKRRVLRVTVDLPEDRTGGVPMDAVSEAARLISAALDESSVMGGTPYVLEVSSPGADRPLTERRHWSRARGRLIRLVAAAGVPEIATGRLVTVDDDGIVLDGERRVGWADIASARVEVEFGRPGDDVDDEFDGPEDEDEPEDDEQEDDEQEDDEQEDDEQEDDGGAADEHFDGHDTAGRS